METQPKIGITTEAGQLYVLTPVPMKTMPSHNPTTWLRFMGRHVPGTQLPESTQDRIQAFMRRHRTEALRDAHGVTYTLAGGMLATCHPEVV